MCSSEKSNRICAWHFVWKLHFPCGGVFGMSWFEWAGMCVSYKLVPGVANSISK